jgi:ABC-2 type transport system ATP-binding protein
MRMVLGLLQPSGGSVSLFGDPSNAGRIDHHCRIGVASETPALYVDMTAEEYLTFFANLYDVHRPRSRVRDLLARFELTDDARKKLRAYSQGMQQRVNLARAFLHDPELLLLDDPVSGLDPHWIKALRDIIEEARSQGKTVFLSSHLLSVVEKVCDRVGIINNGRLLTEGSLERVTGALAGDQTISLEVAAVTDAIVQALKGLTWVRDLSIRGTLITLKTAEVEGIREKIAMTVTKAGGTVLMVQLEKTSLEDAFLELTERNVSLFARQ